MGFLDGGTHFAVCPRALSLSLTPRVRQGICELRKVAAIIRRDARELGDHAVETCTAQLSLPTILFGSRVQPSERGCHCGQRIRLRLLLLLLLRLLLLLLLQLLLNLLLLLLLLLQLLLLLLHLLLNLLLKLLLLLLHLHY